MPRFRAVWPDVAREQLQALSEEARQTVLARIDELLERRDLPASAYDRVADQWVTTYGDGAGLLLLAIVPDHEAVIVLRLL